MHMNNEGISKTFDDVKSILKSQEMIILFFAQKKLYATKSKIQRLCKCTNSAVISAHSL